MLALLFYIIFYGAQTAPVQSPILWNLPLEINDKNSKLNFEVDSTWVLVQGETGGNYGRIYYTDYKNPDSIAGEVHLPIKNFKTGSSMRDRHMYEVMAEADFPEVLIKIDHSEGKCSPAVLETQSSCQLVSYGALTIRDVTRELKLTSEAKKVDDHYEISGLVNLRWPEFNVEDPSQFFAKLHEDVKISYSIKVESALSH